MSNWFLKKVEMQLNQKKKKKDKPFQQMVLEQLSTQRQKQKWTTISVYHLTQKSNWTHIMDFNVKYKTVEHWEKK